MRTAQAQFVDSLRKIRALVSEITTNTTAAMRSPAIREIHETQQCASVVLLTGYFEAFLKDVVKAYIASLSQSNSDFNQLPNIVQNTHFIAGGKVLTEVSKARGSPRFGTLGREDVVSRLYSPCNSTAARSYVILWEAFAETQSNPDSDVVRQIARSLGMDNVWPNIARNSSSGHTDSTLSSTLNDLVTIRNACAHTGTVNPIPGASKLLAYVDCLEWIAEGLISSLEIELQRF